MKVISKIIHWLIKYLIDACGITLLIMFFNWSYPYTKDDMYMITFTSYALLLVGSGFEKLFSSSFCKNKTENKPSFMSDNARKKYSAHEAGHAIMCHELHIPIDYIDIHPEYGCIATAISCQNAKDIKNLILIFYAGAAAEELCSKDNSRLPGNHKAETSDFKRANDLLKEYIVLTDDTVSKTYLDAELIDKMIMYSKKFYEECRNILLDNINTLHELSIILYEKEHLSKTQVNDFFEQQNKR